MYPYFISGQCSLFIPEYRSKESEHGPEIDSGTSFFLVQILKKLLYTWRMTMVAEDDHLQIFQNYEKLKKQIQNSLKAIWS